MNRPKIKSVNIPLTGKEFWRVQKHKALLECEHHTDYLKVIAKYPMPKIEYGDKPYPTPDLHDKSLNIRMLTLRMTPVLFHSLNEKRKNLFRTWRQFILEVAMKEMPDIEEIFRQTSELATVVDV